jgi:hypothetical protein
MFLSLHDSRRGSKAQIIHFYSNNEKKTDFYINALLNIFYSCINNEKDGKAISLQFEAD